MKNLKIKMTISHNEVNENFSVMSLPSTMTVELSKERTKIWQEISNVNPNILLIWAKQIWNITYPNTFGEVIKVEVLIF